MIRGVEMNLIKKCRYGLTIYNNSDIWTGRSIEKYGEYVESEVQVFRDSIKNGDVVLDVGANIGCHSVAFSRLVGPTGIIFAYEPERNNFNLLCGNVAVNNIKNIHCYQKAVGSSSGMIAVPEIDLDKTVNFGSLSLLFDYSKGNHYPVPLIKLDETNFIKVNFIKIDTQGMGKMVLQGAENTIKKFNPILYIENDKNEMSNELIEEINNLNYIAYKHVAPFYNPKNFYEQGENVFVVNNSQICSMNLFCHHRDVPCPIDINKFSMTPVGQGNEVTTS